MENPARKTIHAAGWLFLGLCIGLVPGQIKIDQMRQEIKVTKESTAKEIARLQANLDNLVNHDMMADQTAIDRGKFHTLLITNGAPMPHREFVGIEDPWTHVDIALTSGTIWVLPGVVQPRTLNLDERAAWAVVDPQGHVGRWNAAGFNYSLTEAAR